MMKITELPKEEIEEIRKLAKRVAEEPILVDLMSALCCDIIDRKKKDITSFGITSVQEIREEEADEISPEILKFLKTNMTRSSKAGRKPIRLARLLCFIEEIRKNVLQNVKSNNRLPSCDIKRYAYVFDLPCIMECMKDRTVFSSNEIRLMLAAAINEDDYEGVLENNTGIIETLEEIFKYLSDEQIKNLLKVRKLFRDQI